MVRTSATPAGRVPDALIASVAIAALTLTGCTSLRRTATPEQPPGNVPDAAAPVSAVGRYPLGARVLLPDAAAGAAVLAYRQPVSVLIKPSTAGLQFAAAQVRVCVIRAGSPDSDVSEDPWVLRYADGTAVESVPAPAAVLTLPGYLPLGDQVLPAGRCATGWIAFEVPAGRRPEAVSYARADPRRPLSWTVR